MIATLLIEILLGFVIDEFLFSIGVGGCIIESIKFFPNWESSGINIVFVAPGTLREGPPPSGLVATPSAGMISTVAFMPSEI